MSNAATASSSSIPTEPIKLGKRHSASMPDWQALPQGELCASAERGRALDSARTRLQAVRDRRQSGQRKSRAATRGRVVQPASAELGGRSRGGPDAGLRGDHGDARGQQSDQRRPGGRLAGDKPQRRPDHSRGRLQPKRLRGRPDAGDTPPAHRPIERVRRRLRHRGRLRLPGADQLRPHGLSRQLARPARSTPPPTPCLAASPRSRGGS